MPALSYRTWCHLLKKDLKIQWRLELLEVMYQLQYQHTLNNNEPPDSPDTKALISTMWHARYLALKLSVWLSLFC